MKGIVPILIMMILTGAPSGVYGQKDDEDPVIRIFNKYEEREGVESVTISPTLLAMMKDGKTSDAKTQELISKITGLRILTLTDGADGKGRANRQSLTAELHTVVKKDFKQIMKVKSSDERIELYVRNRHNICNSALLLIASESNSVTVMHLAGTIDKTVIDAVMNGEIGTSNK